MPDTINISGIPFDSEYNEGTGEYDRASYASEVAKYFASIIGNGIVTPAQSSMYDQFRAIWFSGMQISVNPGSAIINGRMCWEDSIQTLEHQVGEAQPRIDLIVVELDVTQAVRAFSLKIVKGTAAAVPVAPILTRNDDIYQLEIASVAVAAGVSILSQANITDKRYDDSVCGFAQALFMQEFDDENNLLKYNRDVLTVDASSWPIDIRYKRPLDSSLFMKRVLTNADGNGFYQTITETFYKADGATVYKTITYTLTYYANGLIDTMTRVVV